MKSPKYTEKLWAVVDRKANYKSWFFATKKEAILKRRYDRIYLDDAKYYVCRVVVKEL